MERRKAGSPLAATIRISEMMCHSLAALHRSMVAPETWDVPEPTQQPEGQVLAFQRPPPPEEHSP
jgi:hypothetical protein